MNTRLGFVILHQKSKSFQNYTLRKNQVDIALYLDNVRIIFNFYRLLVSDVVLMEYGPVSTRDNRVYNGPLGHSLRLFACTAQ